MVNYFLIGEDSIFIGKNTSIEIGAVLSARNNSSITIGDNVIIGPYVVILTTDHIFSDSSQLIRNQGSYIGSISIGNDVWIGSHSTILYGVKIPDGVVIGANSLVKHQDFLDPYSIYAGNPIRKIGVREEGKITRGRKIVRKFKKLTAEGRV